MGKEEKKKMILDEFCTVYKYKRKYAIRLLNSKAKYVEKTQEADSFNKKEFYAIEAAMIL